MTAATGWILVGAALAYLALGAFLMPAFRAPAPRAPRPKLELVRDEQLDISRAIDRGRR